MSEAVLPANGGWGGGRRVTLIGDAAHACRPTDGQGGNLALEDCVIFCRKLLMMMNDKNKILAQSKTCNDFIVDFEKERLPRVRRLHEDQRVRAERSPEDRVPWTPEFCDW